MKDHMTDAHSNRKMSSARDWWNEINDVLIWLQRRWFPFSAIWLGIAAAYLYEFSITRHVPLGLTTPGIESILPTMAVLTALTILGMATGSFAPVIFLPMPHSRRSRLFVSVCSRETARSEKLRRQFIRYWFVASLFMMTVGSALLLVASSTGFEGLIFTAAFGPPVITGCMWSIVVPRLLRRPKIMHAKTKRPDHNRHLVWKRIFDGSLLMTIVSFFLQATVLAGAMYLVAAVVPTELSGDWNRWMLSVFTVLALIATITTVVAVQSSVVSTMALKAVSIRHPLRRAVLLFTGLMILGAAIPPIGGALASIPISMAASGGRGCTIVESGPGTTFRIPDGIHSDPPVENKIAVHILANFAGSYYITRATGDDTSNGTIYSIQHSSIVGISGCKH